MATTMAARWDGWAIREPAPERCDWCGGVGHAADTHPQAVLYSPNDAYSHDGPDVRYGPEL